MMSDIFHIPGHIVPAGLNTVWHSAISRKVKTTKKHVQVTPSCDTLIVCRCRCQGSAKHYACMSNAHRNERVDMLMCKLCSVACRAASSRKIPLILLIGLDRFVPRRNLKDRRHLLPRPAFHGHFVVLDATLGLSVHTGPRLLWVATGVPSRPSPQT